MTDLEHLSTAELAALGSGASFWATKAVGAVPAVTLTDGPHGVRLQEGAADHLGLSGSRPATCFPPAVGLAQTWDPELVERVGAALGDEAQAAGVGVLLGPGVNVKRDPRCGRNFEYFSEDPLVSGVLGAAWVRGLQSRGVGASVKHLAANNAETDRMRASSDVDLRTLREVYLRAFHRVVTEARPWTVMCAYNRVNGTYAAEDPWLLGTVLREEWGFDGVVVSDWAAVRDRVAAVRAGLDLEMPATAGRTDADVVAAVADGALERTAVVRAAGRVAALADRVAAHARPGTVVDADAHHALAREAAARAVVLLRNDGALLPLAADEQVAVVGELARSPRYQGGGSSHVAATRVDVPLDELAARLGPAVGFAAGYTLHGTGDAAALRAEAAAVAAAARTAVVFLGLPEAAESEGFDRTHLDLPAAQLALLDAVLAVQPRTVVVLSHGGVVGLGGVRAPALLDGALLGQGGGAAVADVLLGRRDPSGRLAETVPVRLEDTPAYLTFPGEHGHVVYGERGFVGYRWYDARDLDVAFPFGHGLSYTTFEHSDLELTATADGVAVRVAVRNTGDRAGREVVQVYTGLPGSSVARPPRSLGGFAVVDLEPGEQRTVEVLVERTELAHLDVRTDTWEVEGGELVVSVGASSRDLRLTGTLTLPGDRVERPFTLDSTLAELLADPTAADAVRPVLAGTGGPGEEAPGADVLGLLGSLPLDRLLIFGAGRVDRAALEAVLAAANADRGGAVAPG